MTILCFVKLNLPKLERHSLLDDEVSSPEWKSLYCKELEVTRVTLRVLWDMKALLTQQPEKPASAI